MVTAIAAIFALALAQDLTVLLTLSALLGFVAGLAKELHASRGDFDKRQLGMSLASAVTGLAVGGLVVAVWPAYPLVAIVASVVAGWTGPIVLDYLGRFGTSIGTAALERRAGQVVNPPDTDPGTERRPNE